MAFALAGCREEQQTPWSPPLDEAFRIDLSQLDVSFDFVPEVSLEGRAELRFTLRPGQSRALFHFDPTEVPALTALTALELDGELLDPQSEEDLVEIHFQGTKQRAWELQRELDPDIEHTLFIDWSLPGGYENKRLGWLRTNVDDIPGRGNNRLWPTINSPEELARHTVTVRVHDPREYLMIGSGEITSSVEDGVQVWRLDTGREISSYTVMFAAMPREEVLVKKFQAGSVPVTIATVLEAEKLARAADRTRQTIEALEADFGPFPMPSMQILLTDWDGGMEYYGATTTGMGALVHELIHMYWGCSAINRTWRDTWLDEAINVWWDERGQVPELPRNFESDIVSGRSEIEIGFDTRAYGRGASIIGELAETFGGEQNLIDFLAEVHERRAFEPFTTEDLVEDAVKATGESKLREDFHRWTGAFGP